MARCTNCLIPDAVPGVALGSDGICNLCQELCHGEPGRRAAASDEDARRARERDLEQALATCRGQGEYDCIVALSGGKDSVYLLHRLTRDYGLKVLAFTVDVNLPPLAWDNIRRTVGTLGVDLVTAAPPSGFYKKVFRYLLRNQEQRGAVYTVSYVYAPLFEGDAIKLAIEKRVPLVLAGYSPGQPEPERMLYEFSPQLVRETDWTPPELRRSTEFTEQELSRFYNPARYPAGTRFPRYLAPFHAWRYDQEEIMRRVVELGLVRSRRHANPIHSNYPINWLLMYSDLRAFGFNPYAPEFSALIRHGKANRAYWRLMAPVVDFLIRRRLGPGREVSRSLSWLGLRPEELAITKPRGAYDPPLELAHG